MPALAFCGHKGHMATYVYRVLVWQVSGGPPALPFTHILTVEGHTPAWAWDIYKDSRQKWEQWVPPRRGPGAWG